MDNESNHAEVVRALDQVRAEVAGLNFALPTSHSLTGRDSQQDVVHQLDDYIIPRYRDMAAPIVGVIGGSTGSGKSTILNSIVREHVAHASALRPTTRQPMLLFHASDEQWFTDDRILPGLTRSMTTQVAADPHHHISLHATESLPAGLALIDSPDIDSIDQSNRELAAQLLSAADLWIFVTTAARYADAIPWALLDEAAERNIVVAIVLNRVPQGQGALIRPDLAQRLADRGLSSAPLFLISEQDFDERGFIPDDDIVALRHWLTALTRDAAARSAVVRQTLQGAVSFLTVQLTNIQDCYQEQVDAVRALRWDIDHATAMAQEQLAAGVHDGSLLRGEVLARWQDIVGTGEWTRALEDGVSKIRDRIASWFSPARKVENVATEALEESVHSMLVAQAQAAVLDVSTAWRRNGLVAIPQDIRSDEERNRAAAEIVRQWQEELVDYIREESGSKKTTARVLALGVNALGLALMITVFSATAGLAGGEVAVAGGTAVLAQRVLEAVFGDDAVRRMSKHASDSLLLRAQKFIEADMAVFVAALDNLDISAEHERGLVQVIDELNRSYHGEGRS